MRLQTLEQGRCGAQVLHRQEISHLLPAQQAEDSRCRTGAQQLASLRQAHHPHPLAGVGGGPGEFRSPAEQRCRLCPVH